MSFSKEEITEFHAEAAELLDLAEDGLLKLDKGAELKAHFDSVFRVFHSLKGGAGMLGIGPLQEHMHRLESLLSEAKARGRLSRGEISLFLRGVDAGRKLLAGERVAFDYTAKEGAAAAANQNTPATPAAPAGFPGREAQSAAGKLSVYVVDDEPEIAELLGEILGNTGFRVRSFTKPEDLLAAVGQQRPDVVMTDFKMPGFSGMQVLEAVQKIDSDLPVIFLSGYLNKELLVDAINKGAFAALDKPFREGDVISFCTSAAKQYRLRRAFRQSMNLLVYQFSDLDELLKIQGRHDLRETLRREIDRLLQLRREIKGLA